MRNQQEVAPLANSSADWHKEMERLAEKTTPSFFHLTAQLPKQGRTNQVYGATPNMSVVLKTYANGGENELHAHGNEDHVFLVLQGSAVFFGPKNEERRVKKNDCVLIPRGALYRFTADEGAEPLVMARVGAAVDSSKDVLARVSADGLPFDGYSEGNKETPVILGPHWFE
jgi:mannose-6-phosphate isomerase-like protein (cupin superfamily)